MASPTRVFVSSTYLDNQLRRKLVEEAIRAAGMIPVGMERFEADVLPPVEKCLEMLASCQVLVGILAWRFGWEPPGHDGKSITEIEHDAAGHRLMFLIEGALDPAAVDEGEDKWLKQDKLDKFKLRLAGTPKYFRDETLQMAVFEALQKWAQDQRKARRAVSAARPRLAAAPLERDVRTYLDETAKSLQSLSLAGFETRVRVQLQLEDLFVPLSLRPGSEEHEARLQSGFLGHDPEGPGLHPERLALTAAFANPALAGRRGLAVLGHPGSGKTTHLKRLFLWIARKGAESLGLPADTVPLFVRLRHAQGDEETLAELVEASRQAGEEAALEPRKKPALSADLAKFLLARGRLLFLLDGLDEIADEKAREAVARSIEQGLAAHSDSRFVVTCRFAGYTPSVALSAAFQELHLAPLDADQAATFLRNWFRAVEEALLGDAPEARAKAEREANELLERLRAPEMRSARVVELMRNPLLLTAVCLVHRDRLEGGKEGLPKRRAELYDECVNVLLEHWHKSQNVAVSLPAREARRVLQPLAHWMHSVESRTVASAEEITPVIAPLLKKIRWKSDALGFLKTIRDESGLLTGWSDTRYGFLHLSFQEYLAARELVKNHGQSADTALALAARLGNSWWREVTFLALGLEDSLLFEPFMRAVLAQPKLLEHSEFLRACVLDAFEPSAEPFLEWLQKPHVQDPALWDRQLAALWMLKEAAPERVEELNAHLCRHPDPRVACLFAATKDERVIELGKPRIRLAHIPAGSFRMGTSKEERERLGKQHSKELWSNWIEVEGPDHDVRVSSFYLGLTPVTNRQYAEFLGATPGHDEPSEWANPAFNQPDLPVVGVSWTDAEAFCSFIGGRLPTEAEWEFACRAGTTKRFWSGDNKEDLARVGWYAANSAGTIHPVAEKAPNGFGLFDTHGNVWEWCQDWFAPYSAEDARDPGGPGRGTGRVLRGGGAWSGANRCRSACRFRAHPGIHHHEVGFRVALSVPRTVDARARAFEMCFETASHSGG